jgi:hypothetical protein
VVLGRTLNCLLIERRKRLVINPCFTPRAPGLWTEGPHEGINSVVSHRSAQCFFSGGIGTKIGRCSCYESFEYEWSSYFLIWAATKKITGSACNYGVSKKRVSTHVSTLLEQQYINEKWQNGSALSQFPIDNFT